MANKKQLLAMHRQWDFMTNHFKASDTDTGGIQAHGDNRDGTYRSIVKPLTDLYNAGVFETFALEVKPRSTYATWTFKKGLLNTYVEKDDDGSLQEMADAEWEKKINRVPASQPRG